VRIKYLGFLPDSKTLVVGYHHKVQFWDVLRRKRVRELQFPAPYSLRAMSPGGDFFAVKKQGSFESHEIAIWDVATGRQCRNIQTDEKMSGDPLAFSPEGKYLAGSWKDDSLHLWEVSTGKHLRTLAGHSCVMIESIAFSPDGTILAAQGRTNLVQLWQISTGKRLAGFNRPLQNSCSSVAFSPDGRLLSAGTSAGRDEFGIWDLKTRRELHSAPARRGVNSAVWSPCGTRVASAGTGLWIWDARSGRVIRRLGTAAERGVPFAFSQDGRRLFTYTPYVDFSVVARTPLS
jgi:WD40 repeat protein